MLHNNRIILRNNAGQLTDLSAPLSDITSGGRTVSLSSTDKIYFGSPFPFNHRYFEILTPNDQASSVTMSIWDGGAFIPVVDLIDQTSVAGAAFSQSGIISWVPDRDTNTWGPYPRSSDIPELSAIKIYDLYWARMSFSASMNAQTALLYVGHKFSSDADLALEYPDLVLAKVKTAYKSGKTDWTEQTILAGEYIIQDLKEMGVIIGDGQILDWKVFQKASVHKVASIIYAGLGSDYSDNKKESEKSYRAALQIKSYSVDKDLDARLGRLEQTRMTEFMGR